MVIDFNGKTALVTGGAGGIGMACVKNLLESNAKVAVVDVSDRALEAAQKELEGKGIFGCYKLDISQVDAIAPAIEKIRKDMGEIEILVQTAGLLKGKRGLDMTQEDWDTMLNVNARGMFFVMQQVVAQSMAARGGSIVNFASMAGIRGMHPPMCSAFYSASKGAVVAVTMQAAVEWAGLGVRVNCVAPGGVETPAMREMGFPPEVVDPIPMKRLNQPEDVANAVVFLASDKAATITGQTLVIDGGASVVGY